MNDNLYENSIVHFWDIEKVNKFLLQDVPFENLIFEKTDVLLESILRNEYILFKRILNKGFPVEKSKFNYLIPILTHYDDYKKRYVDIFFKYTNPENYINKKGGLFLETSLSIIAQQTNKNMIIEISNLGGDWNITNNIGQTPLHFLIRYNFELNDLLLQELESKKIDINIEDKFGISVKKIIDSFLLDNNWLTNQNIKLLEVLKYEHRK